MRRIVIITTSIVAAGIIAVAAYLSAAGLNPAPVGPEPAGTNTCAPRGADGAEAEGERVPCGDQTGKPGEVKP